METIAHPGIGEDVTGFVLRFYFVAELVDENAEILRLVDALTAPHRVKSTRCAERLKLLRLYRRRAKGLWSEQSWILDEQSH